jgi:hypothetical protein
MSNEEEFYKEYYKYFSGDTDNIYQFKGYNNNFYQSKKKTEKSNKKLKFGSEGAIVKYSAFEGAAMSLNLNFKFSNGFIEKLDRRIDKVQKALEDIRRDLRKSEDF